MYEFLLGLGLLVGAASTDTPITPECTDPQIIKTVETQAIESLPLGFKIKINYTYPTAPFIPEIGLRKCAAEVEMSYFLVPQPETVTGYFEIQTIGDKFVVRLMPQTTAQ